MKRKSRSKPHQKRNRRSPRYNQMVQTMDDDCPICLEPLYNNETVTLDCGHLFHQSCFVTWCMNKDPCLCPLCRSIIDIPPLENPFVEEEKLDIINPYFPTVSSLEDVIHEVVLAGDIDLIRRVLESGVNVNATDYYGRTPLMIVIENNRVDVVDLLIEYGANVNMADNNGHTPLMYAIFSNVDVVGTLIANGANVNARDNRRRTPLMLAREYGRTDFERLLS
jgi:hypothetical protein